MNATPKSNNNLGGIAKVWAIPSSRVEIPSQPVKPNKYELPEGWASVSLELLPVFQSGRFQESTKTETGGLYYESVVSVTLAKDQPDLQGYLQDLSERTWTILSQDQNGLFRLTGSREYPLRSTLAKNTGAEISDLNHVRVEFSGTSPYPSVFILDPFR